MLEHAMILLYTVLHDVAMKGCLGLDYRRSVYKMVIIRYPENHDLLGSTDS